MDGATTPPKAIGIDFAGTRWSVPDSANRRDWRLQKGKSTDYVKRQYIGNVGKKENDIVAATAYGLVDGMILPLTFEVYKLRGRLKSKSKQTTDCRPDDSPITSSGLSI